MIFGIRPATLTDYEGLSELFQEADTLHIEAHPEVFRHTEAPVRSREYVAELILREESLVLVAERNAEIIGLLIAHLRQSPDVPFLAPRCYVSVEDVAVRQSCQRQGVGTALLQEAHNWALAHGATQVELTVWEFNKRARAFYEGLGYRTVSRLMTRPLTPEDSQGQGE
ncbi:MAG: GNAT family N-acetyltransferase [Chloroflexi bacterium]|nr:GNAT family N-acetyltransferase [Chloroflexota bacterium]